MDETTSDNIIAIVSGIILLVVVIIDYILGAIVVSLL